MRLLVTSYFLRPVGGTETYLRSVFPMLRDRYKDVGVLSLDEDNVGVGDDDLTGIERLKCPCRASEDVLRCAAAWKPDVVYNHGLFLPELDDALARNYPTIYYAHNYGGSCISGSKCHSFPSPTPCERVLGPGCLVMYLPRRCGGLNPLVAVAMYRRERRRQAMLKRCRAVLVASRHMQSEMIRNGVPAERVDLVPLFPTGTVAAPYPPDHREQSGRILLVGRLTPLKGWQRLLTAIPSAAARLKKPLTLVIAGEGQDQEEVRRRAEQLGVSIELLGWIDPRRRNEEMERADLIAVPSVWPEPFGLTGIEAGCVGLPAVGFAVGGIPDWLIPGVSGEMAPLDKDAGSSSFADAIVRALSDETHWHRLRLGAWETARRFSAAAHLERLMPILESAAN